MAVAFVAKAQNTTLASVTTITATISPTAGHTIVGSVTWGSSTIPSPNIKDNLGNSATIIDNRSDAGGPTTTISFIFPSAASGVTGYIFTPPSGHINGTGIEVHEISGASGNLDGHNIATAASGTTQTTPSITTTAAGDYIYCYCFGNITGNSNITAVGGSGASFTLRNSDVTNDIGGDSNAIQAAAGAVNGTFTIGVAEQFLVGIVAIKAAAGAVLGVGSFVNRNQPVPQFGPKSMLVPMYAFPQPQAAPSGIVTATPRLLIGVGI